ncbi:uncharacterized protein LOC109715510 isoform X3 [Ananas comosus]|uniref:Uncharacterized protein LOC109715510 isoform X3 n=1 Tax=Ananas comosus TaxID=4615 RepID=A0A6P5FIJ2_ANACO|nr:uncharacterized protein LOC109715510 isoform X3 [Ananas comosus]
MASKWSYVFCLLWFCLHVVCGRELYYKGREWKHLSHLVDPPIYNIQLEGYHKLRDSNERNHSSGSVHYNSVVTPPDDIHHFAHYETKYGAYYGTRAKINLWGHPYLKRFQRSSTMLWVLNFDSGANVIEAGFHVFPGLYQDSKLHFFVFWTDPHTGDWWLYREDLAMPQVIGYWPKSLFTTLADSATLIRWGGFVTYSQKETGPPMGSGHYPDELEQKAAYIKNIELFNSDGKSCDLIDGMQSAYTDARKCYKVSALVDSSKFGLHDGFLFYFGGPPGCTK